MHGEICMTFGARMLARFAAAILWWLSLCYFSVLSVASPRGFLPASGRFVVCSPFSSHPLSSMPRFHPFYWSAWNQDSLGGSRQNVSACAHASTALSWIEPSVACRIQKSKLMPKSFAKEHLCNLVVMQKEGTNNLEEIWCNISLT